MKRLPAITASIAAVVALAGCVTDGDGPPPLTQEELAELRADPRIVRAERILDRADTLLVPALHADVAVSAEGQSGDASVALRGSCTGTQCYLTGPDPDDTMTLSLDEFGFMDPDPDARIVRFQLGERGGFDTVLVEGTSQLSEDISGDEFAVGGAALNYGFWAEHGFASVIIASASISATTEDGEEVQADFTAALAYIAGDATGSNPTGMGSASWRGIAEAVETSTYRSRFGTATVTIPDLSRPSVDVDIALAGRRIGSAAWSGIPLRAGRYETGVSGRDRLVGNFHGPVHQETYGVFDTGAYVGAYGATR